MLHHKGNEGKPASGDWHAFRDRARREAFSEEEFSDKERTQYDLDEDDPRSADITGEDNPETYTGQNTDVGPDRRHDSRELPWRS